MNYDPQAINDFATHLALAGALPAALAFFTFVLGRPRKWWRSLLGWVLALLLLSILLVFVLVLGRRLAGEYAGYQWTAIAVYSLLTIALWLVWAIIIRERREGRALGFIPIEDPKPSLKGNAMSIPITAATVPEIWYKAQRVLRTIVAVGIPAIIAAATVLPLIIEAAGLPADLPLRLWLVGFAAGLTAVAASITRIMAIPQVNAWLINLGLGSVPKAAIEAPQVVTIDPKVADNGAASAASWSSEDLSG
jgi:hypothetical protein